MDPDAEPLSISTLAAPTPRYPKIPHYPKEDTFAINHDDLGVFADNEDDANPAYPTASLLDAVLSLNHPVFAPVVDDGGKRLAVGEPPSLSRLGSAPVSSVSPYVTGVTFGAKVTGRWDMP